MPYICMVQHIYDVVSIIVFTLFSVLVNWKNSIMSWYTEYAKML